MYHGGTQTLGSGGNQASHRMGFGRKRKPWQSVDMVLIEVRSCSTRTWRELGLDSPGHAVVGMGF